MKTLKLILYVVLFSLVLFSCDKNDERLNPIFPVSQPLESKVIKGVFELETYVNYLGSGGNNYVELESFLDGEGTIENYGKSSLRINYKQVILTDSDSTNIEYGDFELTTSNGSKLVGELGGMQTSSQYGGENQLSLIIRNGTKIFEGAKGEIKIIYGKETSGKIYAELEGWVYLRNHKPNN